MNLMKYIFIVIIVIYLGHVKLKPSIALQPGQNTYKYLCIKSNILYKVIKRLY